MTYAEAITAALQLIGVLAYHESADAEHGALGLATLNAMMTGWESDNIRIGYFPTSTLTDAMNIAPKYERAVIANLAIDLCPSYERAPSLAVVRMADTGYQSIVRDSVYENRVESVLTDQPIGDGSYGSSRILTG